MSLAPCEASRIAVARPIPVVPPVMRILFPFIDVGRYAVNESIDIRFD